MDNEINNLYNFGDFRFDAKRHKLWQNERLIQLPPKALELLALLVKRQGEFVTKEEIFETVWADTFVEDGVLTQNIYTLRKALGKDADGQPLIENKTRLGYRITIPVFVSDAETERRGEAEIQNKPEPVEAAKYEIDKLPASARSRLSASVLIAIVGLILTTVIGIIAYRFMFPETTVTISRLERINIQKITDTADIAYPTLSPDGNLAAYVRGAGSDGGNIYVKDLNTSVETRLDIPNVKRLGFIRFSADGSFLYLRNRSSVLIPSEILKVSRYGGEAMKIAENVWSGFSLSPDEKLLAFARALPNENRHVLMIKNLENGGETEILTVNAPEELRFRSYPAWSPDGARIAYLIDRQNQSFDRVVIYDVQTKRTENLQFKNFKQVEQVLWLPKKNALLVSARESKFYQLWEISLADKKLSRITNDLNTYLMPTISADGRKLLTTQYNFFTNLWTLEEENLNAEKQITFGISNRDGYNGIDYLPSGEIVYTSNEGESGDGNLWRINPATGERRQLTNNAGKRNENPVASPDGRFIYFMSDRSGRAAIWQIEADGENPKQITSSENASDVFPQISPDGNWLYFIRRSGKSSAVFRKSLTENREEQISETEKFAPTNFLSLSPDGRFLGFHNLTEKIQAANPQQAHQVAVIEIENPNNVKIFNLGGRVPQIFWTADGSAFDFIIPFSDRDEIRRQSFTEEKPLQILKVFPKQEIYFISRSPDNKTFVIARGRQQNDAVLITDFE